MYWLTLLGFAVWVLLVVIFGLFVRRLPGSARLVLIVLVFGGIAALFYFIPEYVTNKGPDDWGLLLHDFHPLISKFGPLKGSSTLHPESFQKDADGSGSGNYRVAFAYDQHKGVLLCHYDKITGKFDRDEIVPDN